MTKVSGPQLLHQNQMLTANSNRSQQIQIAHMQQIQIAHMQQIQIAHSKLQIAHSKFKSPTANSNRSQQIQESAFLSRVEGIFLECRGSLFYTEKWARLQNTRTTYIEPQNDATAVPQSGYNLFTTRSSYSVPHIFCHGIAVFETDDASTSKCWHRNPTVSL